MGKLQSKDLRLGNLVSIFGHVIKVTDINRFEFKGLLNNRNDYSEKRVSPEKSDGIELTPDWLIKLGFEEISKNYFIHKIGFSYYYNVSGGVWKFETEDKGIEIKYVHQLQNIYFALTGEELKPNI